MLLTKPQQQRFWREWSAAVHHLGWRELNAVELDQKRRAFLRTCGFNSLTEVDRTAGFDRVLAALGQLQDNLQKTIETDHPELGARRRLLWQLEQLFDQLTHPYALAICKARFGHTRLDDLADPQLIQLRNTLTARLHSKRKKQGARAPSPAVPQEQIPF